MELALTLQDLEPLPIRKHRIKETIHLESKGILNSNYQNIVRKNYIDLETSSLFSIRQRIKSRQYQITSGIDTILKLSVFVTVFILIFS